MESLIRATVQCSDLEVHISRIRDRLLEFRMKCNLAVSESNKAVKAQLDEDPIRRQLSVAKSQAARCESALAFRDADSAMAEATRLWTSVAASYQLAHVIDACPE